MSYTELIRERYSDIIHSTVNWIPANYDVICFDKFMDKIFPNLDAFISSKIIGEIRSELISKYGNDRACIKEYGIPGRLKFDELKYYQKEVGINGSRHTQMHEPVYVIELNGLKILYNGYHRVFFQIISNIWDVDAYVLELNKT